MKNIIIEIPSLEDQFEINKLAVQVHDLHVAWRPDIFIKCDNMMPLERLTELVDNKQIFVAKINNKIVGFITFNIREKSNVNGMRDRKQINIDSMCVDQNLRGKGIGTAMLEHMKKFCKENNCTDLYLTVNEENENAIHLYEKVGFKVKNIAYMNQIK